MKLPFLLFLTGVSVMAAPCLTGTEDCLENLPLGGPGRFVRVYRSHPLALSDVRLTRALIVIHGAGRNADNYFVSGIAGAFLAGGFENTIVAAPRFAGAGSATCNDKLAAGEIAFRCGGSDWRGGGGVVDEKSTTSYDVIDDLIRRFSDKKKFPNLKQIVLFGHSAGGQFLSRYGAASKVEPSGVSIHYVVSNPSSYLYLDSSRPGPTDGCPAFNDWKYGLAKKDGYAELLNDKAMQENLIRRNMVYLLGGYDTTPQFGFDSSCAAMAQGPNRLVRGEAYFKYITTKYGAKHKFVVVPNCGHNGRCMLVADEARATLFP